MKFLKWIIAGVLVLVPTVVEVEVSVGHDQNACAGVTFEFLSHDNWKLLGGDGNGLQ